jgi:formylglycine-generating enzyme required for sulfatase activity
MMMTDPDDLEIEPPMRQLPGGTFLMGDASGRADEQPAHKVRVLPFAIAVYPVSVREYAAFLIAMGHELPVEWGDERFAEENLPVCGVSWFDAVAYADWLSELTGRHFHLPTEAQREFAARGGRQQQAYPWGDEALPLAGYYAKGLDGPLTGGPIPLGIGEPNGFGLYHMADNVHEWCADWYDRKYYAVAECNEPRGPAATDRRAVRGGSWRHHIKYCRCAARSSLAPHKRFTDFGFRLAESDDFAYVG